MFRYGLRCPTGEDFLNGPERSGLLIHAFIPALRHWSRMLSIESEVGAMIGVRREGIADG